MNNTIQHIIDAIDEGARVLPSDYKQPITHNELRAILVTALRIKNKQEMENAPSGGKITVVDRSTKPIYEIPLEELTLNDLLPKEEFTIEDDSIDMWVYRDNERLIEGSMLNINSLVFHLAVNGRPFNIIEPQDYRDEIVQGLMIGFKRWVVDALNYKLNINSARLDNPIAERVAPADEGSESYTDVVSKVDPVIGRNFNYMMDVIKKWRDEAQKDLEAALDENEWSDAALVQERITALNDVINIFE